jgi:DNA-binding NarL/FixJ family response regulator
MLTSTENKGLQLHLFQFTPEDWGCASGYGYAAAAPVNGSEYLTAALNSAKIVNTQVDLRSTAKDSSQPKPVTLRSMVLPLTSRTAPLRSLKHTAERAHLFSRGKERNPSDRASPPWLVLGGADDVVSTMRSSPISVLLADVQPIVLNGLRAVLARDPGIRIVGETTNEFEIIEQTLALDPDVVVMDLRVRGENRLDILRELRVRARRSRTLLFTSSGSVDHFAEAIRSGCSGILLKENSTAVIPQGIRAVGEGSMWFDSGAIRSVMQELANSADTPTVRFNRRMNSVPPPLTGRECNLIALLGMGYKNKELANKMFVSEHTVKKDLRALYKSFGVSDRMELVLYAIAMRLLTVTA